MTLVILHMFSDALEHARRRHQPRPVIGLYRIIASQFKPHLIYQPHYILRRRRRRRRRVVAPISYWFSITGTLAYFLRPMHRSSHLNHRRRPGDDGLLHKTIMQQREHFFASIRRRCSSVARRKEDSMMFEVRRLPLRVEIRKFVNVLHSESVSWPLIETLLLGHIKTKLMHFPLNANISATLRSTTTIRPNLTPSL